MYGWGTLACIPNNVSTSGTAERMRFVPAELILEGAWTHHISYRSGSLWDCVTPLTWINDPLLSPPCPLTSKTCCNGAWGHAGCEPHHSCCCISQPFFPVVPSLYLVTVTLEQTQPIKHHLFCAHCSTEHHSSHLLLGLNRPSWAMKQGDQLKTNVVWLNRVAWEAALHLS